MTLIQHSELKTDIIRIGDNNYTLYSVEGVETWPAGLYSPKEVTLSADCRLLRNSNPFSLIASILARRETVHVEYPGGGCSVAEVKSEFDTTPTEWANRAGRSGASCRKPVTGEYCEARIGVQLRETTVIYKALREAGLGPQPISFGCSIIRETEEKLFNLAQISPLGFHDIARTRLGIDEDDKPFSLLEGQSNKFGWAPNPKLMAIVFAERESSPEIKDLVRVVEQTWQCIMNPNDPKFTSLLFADSRLRE